MVHEIKESLNIIKDKMEEQIIIMEDVEVEPAVFTGKSLVKGGCLNRAYKAYYSLKYPIALKIHKLGNTV